MSTVKGFYDREGNIIPYDYRYLANSPTKLSNFTNDLFGEQREVVQEITKDSFVYDEVLQAYTFFIDSALTWLVVDDNVSVLGNKIHFYHHGRIAVGNKGSGKIDELRMFVKDRYPELIDGKRFYLGSLTNDRLFRLDDSEVIKLIVNLISYAMIRDEYRDYVKGKK